MTDLTKLTNEELLSQYKGACICSAHHNQQLYEAELMRRMQPELTGDVSDTMLDHILKLAGIFLENAPGIHEACAELADLRKDAELARTMRKIVGDNKEGIVALIEGLMGDSERLDAMIEHEYHVSKCSRQPYKYYIHDRRGKNHGSGDTPREAIDAAIKADKEAEDENGS